MRIPRTWSSGSRRLSILLLAVVLPPAATLIWLGTQLLQQDRVVIAQRELERRTAVGHAVAAHLRHSLAEAERLFDATAVPDGFVRFAIARDRLDVTPATALLWTPVPRALVPAAEALFDEATLLEYRGDSEEALAAYRRFARSPDRAIRAGALRRIARVHWKKSRWEDALASYRELAEFRDVSDLDIPSDLLARRNAGDALHAAGRTLELGREAAALERDLLASAWSIDRVAWDLTAADIERWLGVPVDVPPARRTFSLLAEALWREFRAGASAGHPPHRVIDVDGASITVLVRSSPDGLTAVAVSPEALHTWITDAVSGAYADGARLAIAPASGTLLAGTEAPSGVPTIRLASSDTGLPWALTLHSDSWSRAGEQIEYRRLLLTIGLVSILLLLGGGSCVLWLVVRREIAVSRLQTEFVAAVSHEFRTPLTSLRHVTELLEEDDEMPPGKRRTFYAVYRRNTERLHQLVESLLDFARMEAGRRPYERRPIDAAAFATDVVAAFERHGAPGLGRVEIDVSAAAGLQLQGDRDALVNALGNLLDNAVKYSPDGRPVHVSVRPHPSGAAIAVRDQGLGIVRHEREAIFQRFVRGTQARELGIKGTGLGLAMVAHIVRAHGGTIAVESDEGVGSTFTIVLPAHIARPDGGTRREPA